MNTFTKMVVALIVLGALGFLAWRYVGREAPDVAALVTEAPGRLREALAPTPPTPEAPATDEAAGAALEHPIATDPTLPLPALDASDADLIAALTPVLPPATLGDLLDPQQIVRRMVVSIDNLPGGKLPMKQRPVKAVPGRFAVEGEDDALVIAEANHARYTPLVVAAEQISPTALVAVYRRYYPLFQQAYQELGYPDGYFNDRVVAVLDHLIAAEPVSGPIRLTRPNVLYRYADPALEARSPGEKALLRMGPDNAARVQAVLARWRAALLAEE